MSEKIVLITGVTGQQGGALARALSGKGFKLRGMTRKPDGDAAKKLAAIGVEVVSGDLDDVASLKSALAGAWGVFGVQNTWEAVRTTSTPRSARPTRRRASPTSTTSRASKTSCASSPSRVT
jgi:uncharacterized protein YbjT (DUF2867 family)